MRHIVEVYLEGYKVNHGADLDDNRDDDSPKLEECVVSQEKTQSGHKSNLKGNEKEVGAGRMYSFFLYWKKSALLR